MMEAIQTILNNLEPRSDTKVKLIVQENNIYIQKAKPTIRVYVTDYNFITNYIIPFLDSIKELDYLDWKLVIKNSLILSKKGIKYKALKKLLSLLKIS